MMSRIAAIAALSFLAACATSVPDSNPTTDAGVGFTGYDDYASARAHRDAELKSRQSHIPEEQAIAQETLGVLNATGSSGTTTAAITEQSTDGAPLASTDLVRNNAGISDEQNFDAVSSRETIESDRDRLQRQRDAFQVAQPQAVPERPGRSSGASVVNFALSTTNQVGQAVYERPGNISENRYRRACAKYGSSDQAQAAFLSGGGPKRDRKGLDPDGDGFACFWDPTPFRAALR